MIGLKTTAMKHASTSVINNYKITTLRGIPSPTEQGSFSGCYSPSCVHINDLPYSSLVLAFLLFANDTTITSSNPCLLINTLNDELMSLFLDKVEQALFKSI